MQAVTPPIHTCEASACNAREQVEVGAVDDRADEHVGLPGEGAAEPARVQEGDGVALDHANREGPSPGAVGDEELNPLRRSSWGDVGAEES